jgi:uncharacterized membrane protein YbaN (DUF454 family)
LKKVLRIAAGVGLVLIGIVGLILPVMPGWVFIIPGLVILADHSPRIRRLLEWAKAKFEDARSASGRTRSAPASSATMEDRPDPGK